MVDNHRFRSFVVVVAILGVALRYDHRVEGLVVNVSDPSDPANPSRQIRFMPGYGEGVRPDPLTAGPYAVVSQNGMHIITKVPLAGNPTLL